MDHPSEHECKMLYAKYLHKCKGDAFDAMRLFRAKFAWVDDSFAMTYSKLWVVDDIVEAEVERLKAVTPSKEEVANYVWERAQKADDADAAKLVRLTADILGFIVKVSTSGRQEGTEDTFDDGTVPPLEPDTVPAPDADSTEGVTSGELQSEVS